MAAGTAGLDGSLGILGAIEGDAPGGLNGSDGVDMAAIGFVEITGTRTGGLFGIMGITGTVVTEDSTFVFRFINLPSVELVSVE